MRREKKNQPMNRGYAEGERKKREGESKTGICCEAVMQYWDIGSGHSDRT